MTTIATDGLTVAADSRSMRGDVIVSHHAVKLHRQDDGSVVGCSGRTPDCETFRAWLKDGGKRPKPTGGFSALHVRVDGSVWLFTEVGEGCRVDVPAAIGSGAEFAVGAMLAGADPEKAVEVAGKRDPYTGGRTEVMRARLPVAAAG